MNKPKRCKDSRCRHVLDYFIYKSNFIQYLLAKKHNNFNSPKSNTNFKPNLIYLLSCENCGFWYVGKRALTSSKHTNIHHTNKKIVTTLIKKYVSILKKLSEKSIFYSKDWNFGWFWLWWRWGIRQEYANKKTGERQFLDKNFTCIYR